MKRETVTSHLSLAFSPNDQNPYSGLTRELNFEAKQQQSGAPLLRHGQLFQAVAADEYARAYLGDGIGQR